MDATISQQAISYRGWIIERETEPWSIKYGQNYRYMPEGGISEDYKYAETIEEAKDEIDEQAPKHLVVLEDADARNRHEWQFDCLNEARKFASFWNADLYPCGQPILNP